MKHLQDDNAFAYVIYEKAAVRLKTEGPLAPWRRTRMFYAANDVFDRDQMWEREVAWRNPKNTRVVPLYDEDANDARQAANLDAINTRYEAETNGDLLHGSLAAAVDWVFEKSPPDPAGAENLIKTLEAFDYMVQQPLSIPAHTVQRAGWPPTRSEIDEFLSRDEHVTQDDDRELKGWARSIDSLFDE